MKKQDHFILAVQTGLIIRNILTPPLDPSLTAENTMYHALAFLEDAVDASKRIPEDKTANEAACDFLAHVFGDTSCEKQNPFAWFMRS